MNMRRDEACMARRFRGTVNSSKNLLRVFLLTSFSASSNTWISVPRSDEQTRCTENRTRRTVEIARSLEVGVAQTTQRLERLRIATLHHVPSGRLRAAIDLDSYKEGRNTSLYARGHRQLPVSTGYP